LRTVRLWLRSLARSTSTLAPGKSVSGGDGLKACWFGFLLLCMGGTTDDPVAIRFADYHLLVTHCIIVEPLQSVPKHVT
jgi:hypothetical protein